MLVSFEVMRKKLKRSLGLVFVFRSRISLTVVKTVSQDCLWRILLVLGAEKEVVSNIDSDDIFNSQSGYKNSGHKFHTTSTRILFSKIDSHENFKGFIIH